MDQIEQMNKVFARMLSDFLGLKSQGKTSLGIEYVSQTLKNELDLDTDLITELSTDELTTYFQQRKLIPGHMEKLIKLMTEAGEYKLSTDMQAAISTFESIIKMYTILDSISDTLSFERIKEEARIRSILHNFRTNNQ